MSLKGLQDMRSPDSQRESSGLREGQTSRFSPPRRLSRSLDEGQEGVDIREGRPGDRIGPHRQEHLVNFRAVYQVVNQEPFRIRIGLSVE